MSKTRDSSTRENELLLKKGRSSYFWASQSMKIIENITSKYKRKFPLNGFNLGFCLHITKETSVLLMAVKKLGGNVSICSANPLSIQNDILHFLLDNEISVYAKKDETVNEYHSFIHRMVSKINPHVLTDDGGLLHLNAHKYKINNMIGGTEETTSGIHQLKELDLQNKLLYPIIGVNNAYTKHMFDNRYGTGQSTIDGILRVTGIFFPGKIVVVCGYGWVGKGLSSFLKGYGCKVIVTEVDPIRALEAHMDGFYVYKLIDVCDKADLFITCTGQKYVINRNHINKMKDGAILANAGHFDVEINTKYLYTQDKKPEIIKPNLECFKIKLSNNKKYKKIYLLSKGRVINLIGSEGHSSEVMSLSFANQLLSILYLVINHEKLESKLYNVPKEIDDEVAKLTLSNLGIKIDELSLEQRIYHKEKINF